jgi:hypothetical protein
MLGSHVSLDDVVQGNIGGAYPLTMSRKTVWRAIVGGKLGESRVETTAGA